MVATPKTRISTVGKTAKSKPCPARRVYHHRVAGRDGHHRRHAGAGLAQRPAQPAAVAAAGGATHRAAAATGDAIDVPLNAA